MVPKLIIKFFRAVYELVEVFVLSASVFIIVYLFLMQPHQVSGNSMVPTFHNQEYLLTDKITYRKGSPEYGDVIVFKSPINERVDFIKRVVAVAGDRVMIKDNKVYKNGMLLDESLYLPADYVTIPESFLREGIDFTVPADTVFAMGDNRSHSSDSREWGPVPLENIVGRAFFRYWPPSMAGVIKNPVKQ